MTSEQRGPDRVLTLTQQKFCADGSVGDDTLWMVPITISTQEQPSKVYKYLQCDHFACYIEGFFLSNQITCAQ